MNSGHLGPHTWIGRMNEWHTPTHKHRTENINFLLTIYASGKPVPSHFNARSMNRLGYPTLRIRLSWKYKFDLTVVHHLFIFVSEHNYCLHYLKWWFTNIINRNTYLLKTRIVNELPINPTTKSNGIPYLHRLWSTSCRIMILSAASLSLTVVFVPLVQLKHPFQCRKQLQQKHCPYTANYQQLRSSIMF